MRRLRSNRGSCHVETAAAAFHEAVSVQRLEALFFSLDWNGLFAGTIAMQCPQCRGPFGVFFQSSDDPKNAEYLKVLEDLIGRSY